MKNKYYTFVALLVITLSGIAPATGQNTGRVTDTIYTGAGYVNEVYYSMAAGTKGVINRKQWDIAFRASRMSASILTNDAANNSAIALDGVELFAYPKSDTSGWAAVDTAGFSSWKKLANSTTDWEDGAFCRNQKGHPDYGWGRYNSSSHNVKGDSLFVIKLRDGSFRKLWIMEKYSSNNVFKFRFAKLNGSSDTTIMVDCKPYSARNFVGFSLLTNQVVDFEPVASSEWDILFTKYMYTYPASSPTAGTLYPVTGVLSNYKVKVNKYRPVSLDYTMFDLATMDSTRSPIGWDWKQFNNSTFAFQIVDSSVYFVQDQVGNIHKLIFKDFAGSSTGRIVLQKEYVGTRGINETEKPELNAVVYPNPAKDVMNLVINPGKSEAILVSVLNMTGKTVFSKNYELLEETLSTLQVPVSDLSPGMYVVRIQVGTSTIARKVIVNK